MTNIADGANNKPLCCMDFLINDIAKFIKTSNDCRTSL